MMNGKRSNRIRYSVDILLFTLLVMLTPFVDMINGVAVRELNTELSIGMIFRVITLTILSFIIAKRCSYRDVIWIFVLMLYFCGRSIISAITNNYSIFRCLSYSVKWLLPPFFITAFKCMYKRDDKSVCSMIIRSIETLSFVFPASLVMPYLLGINLNKERYCGFYYSINDISYILAVLFAYNLFLLQYRLTKKKIVILALLLFSILLMGTKAGYFTVVVAVVCFLIMSNRITNLEILKKIIMFLLIIIFGILVVWVAADRIAAIFNRWSSFLAINNNVISFLTSARSNRIGLVWEGKSETLFNNTILGWVTTYHLFSIEMDFFDLFFQYGVVGLLLICSYYLEQIRNRNKVLMIDLLFVLSIVDAFVAGHLLNAALAGTVFSIFVCLMLIPKEFFEMEVCDIKNIKGAE